MVKQTIPGLDFSTNDLAITYLGKTTKGTYMWYDHATGSVFKWNENSGYFRRNSMGSWDGRNQLVVKRRVDRHEVYDMLVQYVGQYRKSRKMYPQRLYI